MNNYRLGVSTGFAVNRYSEPEEWANIIACSGANYVQFTADMLNVSLPWEIVEKHAKRIIKACDSNGLKINSTFTGAFTRVNHLAHPDQDIRNYWVSWFKKFVDLSLMLESKVMGSHFGIFTIKEDRDPKIRRVRLNQNIDGWHSIGDYAKRNGMDYLMWEPMSITREQGETINSCRILQEMVNKNSPIPFKICLDVDHGDVSSLNPDDTDPYAWLSHFASDAPVIHLKQSSSNKSGHWPFTAQNNLEGRIIPEKVVSILKQKGIQEVDLVLELSFREREPFDSSAPSALKESIDYWRTVVKQ